MHTISQRVITVKHGTQTRSKQYAEHTWNNTTKNAVKSAVMLRLVEGKDSGSTINHEYRSAQDLNNHVEHNAEIATPATANNSPVSSTPMQHAPIVTLKDGRTYLPQHYLNYHQTSQSISALLSAISFDDDMLLFAGTDDTSMYLQVGMIGRENYARGNTVRPRKLVYGRKWRIDTDTPDSEIVQTAFLAIKKAREHEVRELLTITTLGSGKTSAPLSSHQDIHLLTQMANSLTQLDSTTPHVQGEELKARIENLRFGQRRIHITRIEQRQTKQFLIDVKLGSAPLARMVENELPEYDDLHLTLILSQLDHKEFIYALMAALIQHSDGLVDEHFRFQGQARFSRTLDPYQIAELSLATRPYARDMNKHEFAQGFRANNYGVDASRAPQISIDQLGAINRKKIDRYTQLQGHMPKGYVHLERNQSYA